VEAGHAIGAVLPGEPCPVLIAHQKFYLFDVGVYRALNTSWVPLRRQIMCASPCFTETPYWKVARPSSAPPLRL
jgi:hypothetical protein